MEIYKKCNNCYFIGIELISGKMFRLFQVLFLLGFTIVANGQNNFAKWSGSGFALNNGYIATNYHVIEGATTIEVSGIKDDLPFSYEAKVVGTDKINDLAILKVENHSFGNLPYAIKPTLVEPGEEIFVLGYPLINSMGTEVKLTSGIVSAKSGFQGDVSLYQISAPIQSGNSGGPMFDKKGNVVGIIVAKHVGAENANYAIKANFLQNLAESVSSNSIIPTSNSISSLSLPDKVRKLKEYVLLIKCSGDNTLSASTIASLDAFASSAINNVGFKELMELEDGGLFRGVNFDMTKEEVLKIENSRYTTSVYSDIVDSELVITTDMGEDILNFADVSYSFDNKGLYHIKVETYATASYIADDVYQLVKDYFSLKLGPPTLAEDGFYEFYGKYSGYDYVIAIYNLEYEDSPGMEMYFYID